MLDTSEAQRLLDAEMIETDTMAGAKLRLQRELNNLHRDHRVSYRALMLSADAFVLLDDCRKLLQGAWRALNKTS